VDEINELRRLLREANEQRAKLLIMGDRDRVVIRGLEQRVANLEAALKEARKAPKDKVAEIALISLARGIN
jgi:hypothetical protein